MSNTIRVLRTCNADGTSRNGFQWPLTEGAVVECPDWSPVAECGNGLHGLAEGEGDWGLLNWEPDAVALVLEVDESVVVEIGAKVVKFPRAIVRKVGKLAGLLCELACDAKRITAQVTDLISKVGSSDSQLAASGDYSQLAASGDYSRLAASGHRSQLAASGDSSVVCAAAVDCIAQAGESGAIALTYHDGTRFRIAVGYVGEGLDAGAWYRVDATGAFLKVENP